ncbi:MAG: hypothetical protein Q9217_004904, partial [Psora testacea]
MHFKINHAFILWSYHLLMTTAQDAGTSQIDNPCQPGGRPILYAKEYGTDSCPPKYTLNPDGTCPMNTADDCEVYCEIRQRFFYDQEQPVNNGYCHGPLTCTVTTAQTRTWTKSGTGNIGVSLLKVLNIGITGGLSFAEANMVLTSTSINLNDTSCGYFTFLPQLHES